MTLAYCIPDLDALQRTLVQRWGNAPVTRYQAWRDLLRETGSRPEAERLKRINEFFNAQIRFGEDTAIWSQTDFWASPLETLGKGAGDCEDFALAKYFSLGYVGVDPSKLRLTYVKARIGGATSTVTQAHMVLTYYADPDAEPLVLDNLITDIRPASRRPDLIPVFSFNGSGVFAGGGRQPSSPVDRLSRWTDLQARMRAETAEP